jgi:hypothetical protein
MASTSLKCKPGPKPRPWTERFWCRVKKTETCWLWTGNKLPKGYGIIQVTRGKNSYAHRLSWEIFNGRAVPIGMLVLHDCDVPSCVRPEHLRIGTQQDNANDATLRGRRAHPDKTKHLGEANGMAKLSAAQVNEMRAKYWAAPRGVRVKTGTVTALSQQYGVTPTMVSLIVAGKFWKSGD